VSEAGAGARTSALLSVVVPIYNVEDYLFSCLESLAAQTYPNLEVILVDDGSPDSSGAMADAFAAGREHWRVLHVENGGLGRARNIGLDAATGEYVAFVDSDDLVPRDAFELMMHAVLGSGSDMVSGGALRYDGARARPSPLHRQAVPETRMATHVRQMPCLVYDTTAWNKIFRRQFLLDHDLRFAEGIYYEDIPLTVPAHFLARSVDLIEEPVYLWRERQTAEQSITQRRAEVRNLLDRMAAVSSVNAFLERTGEVEGKRVHDLKILTLDMPLFLDVLDRGDDEFAQTLVDVFRTYLEDVAPDVVASLPPRRRLAYHLIAQGRTRELQAAHLAMLAEPKPPVVRRGMRMYVRLPYFRDPAVGVPDAVYDVTRSQTLQTGIRDVRWNGDVLEVDGHALIDGVPDLGPGTTVHRLQLRVAGSKGDRRTVRARRTWRPDVTGRSKTRPVSYDGSGFLARVPSSALSIPAGKDAAEYELVAQVAAPAARRGSVVGTPDRTRALHPPRGWAADGVLVVPGYRGRRLRIVARREPAVVQGVVVDGEQVLLHVRAAPGRELPELWLHLRRLDASEGVTVRVERGSGRSGTARLDAGRLHVSSRSVMERQWRLWLVGAHADDPADASALVDGLVGEASAVSREGARSHTVQGRYVGPVDLDPSPGAVRARLHGRLLLLRQEGVGGAVLVDAPLCPELADFAFTADGLQMHGDTAGLDLERLVLRSAADRLEVPVECSGDTWRALLPAVGLPGHPSVRWLRPGRWEVVAGLRGQPDSDLAVTVSAGAETHLTDTGGDRVTVVLRTTRQHELQLVADGGGSWWDRGAFHDRLARRVDYRVARRMPLVDTVLFEAWKGRQYSDNPRAVFEELRRRGDRRRLVWAVEHHGVEVPDDVERVLVGSRAYYRTLGRARWLVSNDSMPRHFEKREGSRYGQTWHGTPLKRIGWDMETIQMANKNYLEQFAKDVAGWDALVSPNAYSTEIFRRAFRYDGPVLEIGYPRNDVFHRPAEREERRATIAERLGIEAGRRVILYAPTWRDNQYNRSGRYQFALKLDLERMHRRFKDDSVLLVRGHQLVAATVDTSMFGGFARNVSFYPDISDLYLVADVLVTDYSSVMFDFVNTGRPMVFFTHDLEAYRDDLRGFYVDFEAEAPGPLLRHTDEVADALADLDAVAEAHADRYERFRLRYASLEDGQASARFVDQFLGVSS
jgi:CDP-glycerol glycerophosphotransferase